MVRAIYEQNMLNLATTRFSNYKIFRYRYIFLLLHNNYTGEEPDKENPTAPRIVNSNEEHFDLKWWSQYSGHVYYLR